MGTAAGAPRGAGCAGRGCETREITVSCGNSVQSWLSTPFRQRARRSFALLLAMLRVLTVLFAMQLGGVIHGSADLLDATLASAEGEHEHCPPDGPCDDCPPGCPNCHCAAAHGSVAPEPALTSVPEPALG